MARALTDLLTIAKVAMPEELYAIDPRVIRAEKLLAQLEPGQSSEKVLGLPRVAKATRKPPYKASR